MTYIKEYMFCLGKRWITKTKRGESDTGKVTTARWRKNVSRM